MPSKDHRWKDPSLTRDSVSPTFGAYFLWVAATSVPFYALGLVTRLELLPKLPISALAVVCPSVVALVLTYRSGGVSAVRTLVRHSFELRGAAPAWTLLALLLRPSVIWFSYLLPAAFTGEVNITAIPALSVVALFAVFFVAAIAEEIGWTTYALGQLRAHRSTFGAGLQIGIAWAAWHVLPLLSVGRSAVWIMWWGLCTVATRVLLVWLYRITGGGVGAVALSHALHNLAWMSIPTYGSQYDPRVDAVMTLVVTLVALAVTKRAG